MTYNISSQYKGKVTHPKYMTDNSVTYITIGYVIEGISFTSYNINGEVV